MIDVIHFKRLPTWRFSSRELGRGNNSNLGSHPHLFHKQQRETGQDQEEKGVAEDVGGHRNEENIVMPRIEYESVADESISRKSVAACAKTSTARVLPTVGTIENDKDEVWETAVETVEDWNDEAWLISVDGDFPLVTLTSECCFSKIQSTARSQARARFGLQPYRRHVGILGH